MDSRMSSAVLVQMNGFGFSFPLRSVDADTPETSRLAELAVAWVALTPEPMPLEAVPYSR